MVRIDNEESVDANEKSQPRPRRQRTQCSIIIECLRTGKTITAMEAFQMFGITRLAARIHELRCRGYDIQSETVVTPAGKRVEAYYLQLRALV